jgi:hypothetical protein
LALFFIAPVCGELFSGSAPLNEFINPATFVILALLYGGGAVIIRELKIRWDKSWLSIFLLGLAYVIYEEGLMVMSLYDPTWMDLGNLAVYGRELGVNWVWAEHLTIYNAAISIAASIAFVEAFYPDWRDERWVKNRKWWVLTWAGFIGVYIVWEAFSTYNAGILKLFTLVLIAALVVGALSLFLVLGPLTEGSNNPVLYFSNPVFLLLLFLAYIKVSRRVKGKYKIDRMIESKGHGNGKRLICLKVQFGRVLV